MNKAEALKKLEAEMADDRDLPLRESNLVFGEGNIDSTIVFIGEAPGEQENIQKRPFVGRGGQLLNKNIEAIGWKRGDVYITNILKRRPPNNRDPNPEEILAYKPYLTKQLEAIAPEVIVTLGRFAMNYFLPDAKITRDQGTIFRIGGRFIIPMLHPAAALRSPEMMRAFEATFKKLPEAVIRCKSLEKESAAQTPVAEKRTQKPLF